MVNIDEFIKTAYAAIDAADAEFKAKKVAKATCQGAPAVPDYDLAKDSPFKVGCAVELKHCAYNDNSHSIIWTDIEGTVLHVDEDGTFTTDASGGLFKPIRPVVRFKGDKPVWTAKSDEVPGTIEVFRHRSLDEQKRIEENRKHAEAIFIDLMRFGYLMDKGQTVDGRELFRRINECEEIIRNEWL